MDTTPAEMEEWLLGWATGAKHVQADTDPPTHWAKRYSVAFAEGYREGRAAAAQTLADMPRWESWHMDPETPR